MGSFELEINRLQQLMMEKDLQLGEMSSSMQERQLMLQQSHMRIVELEEGQTLLEAQVMPRHVVPSRNHHCGAVYLVVQQ